MPHYRSHRGEACRFFKQAITSVLQQTDEQWHLVLVDDGSPAEIQSELTALAQQHAEKITLSLQSVNRGPGYCRNLGIELAHQKGAAVILFLDADDQAHPQRVEISRDLFASDAAVNVLYSPFEVVNAKGERTAESQMTPSIRQILDVYQTPPEGFDLWKTMGLQTGYMNLTSATSVRVDLARRQPFGESRVSEDFHTWLRYAADGGNFRYTPAIPTRYRIADAAQGSASRHRLGREFYRQKAVVDADGFEQALALAVKHRRIQRQDTSALRQHFRQKLGELLAEEGVNCSELLQQEESGKPQKAHKSHHIGDGGENHRT